MLRAYSRTYQLLFDAIVFVVTGIPAISFSAIGCSALPKMWDICTAGIVFDVIVASYIGVKGVLAGIGYWERKKRVTWPKELRDVIYDRVKEIAQEKQREVEDLFNEMIGPIHKMATGNNEPVN
jgi:hypothetical protein